MNKDTGGPAFPQAEWDNDAQAYLLGGGMTLRDYFAAKAMQAGLQTIEQFPDENWWTGVAKDAYRMADAMLAERSKE